MSSVISTRVREEDSEELAIRARLRKYIERWIKLLEEAVPSEKGFQGSL